jgi:hypothetical protein
VAGSDENGVGGGATQLPATTTRNHAPAHKQHAHAGGLSAQSAIREYFSFKASCGCGAAVKSGMKKPGRFLQEDQDGGPGSALNANGRLHPPRNRATVQR